MFRKLILTAALAFSALTASAEEYKFTVVNNKDKAVNLAICNWQSENRGDTGYQLWYRGYRSNGWYVLQPGEEKSFTFSVDKIDIHMNSGDLNAPIVPDRYNNKAQHMVHPNKQFVIKAWLQTEDGYQRKDVNEIELESIDKTFVGPVTTEELKKRGIKTVDFYSIPTNTRLTIRR